MTLPPRRTSPPTTDLDPPGPLLMPWPWRWFYRGDAPSPAVVAAA